LWVFSPPSCRVCPPCLAHTTPPASVHPWLAACHFASPSCPPRLPPSDFWVRNSPTSAAHAQPSLSAPPLRHRPRKPFRAMPLHRLSSCCWCCDSRRLGHAVRQHLMPTEVVCLPAAAAAAAACGGCRGAGDRGSLWGWGGARGCRRAGLAGTRGFSVWPLADSRHCFLDIPERTSYCGLILHAEALNTCTQPALFNCYFELHGPRSR
jgi:hypothetical protein